MKKLVATAVILLAGGLVWAQTVVQPSHPAPGVLDDGKLVETVALAMTALCVTGLIFYISYVSIQKKGFWGKRKRQIMKHAK